MSKAFDTVHIRKLIEKLSLTNTPHILQKFLSNYIKGRKAFTTYNNKNSKQMILKSGVPQGGVLSPILFNLYMSDLPTPPENVTLTSYADDLNPHCSHTNIKDAELLLQPYLDQIYYWTKENDLMLNPNKSTATLFSPDPKDYTTKLNLTINNELIDTITHPKILGVIFDPKLTFNEHSKYIKGNTNKSLNVMKSLTSTSWGKQKEPMINTFKAIVRPSLEYACTVWSPIISETNLQKIQSVQNSALRIATGCTSNTNQNHLHIETQILPLKHHFNLHASNMKQKSAFPNHPLNHLLKQPPPIRTMKHSLYQSNNQIVNPPTEDLELQQIALNIQTNHTLIVGHYKNNLPPNKVINQQAPSIDPTEEYLPRKQRSTLAQIRANKSPLLYSYKNLIDETNYPSPLCPLCKLTTHDSVHLFNCPLIETTLKPLDLWMSPVESSELLDAWWAALDSVSPQ